MKLNEIKDESVFDSNYYDYLQDEMKRKAYDPFEDKPQTDTDTDIQDFVVSSFEVGKLSYEEAKNRLKQVCSTPYELKFWTMELAMAAELLDD